MATHSSTSSRKAGSSAYSAATMPGYCSPTPAIRNPTLRPIVASVRPSGPATSASSSAARPVESAMTTLRWPKSLRPTWSV